MISRTVCVHARMSSWTDSLRTCVWLTRVAFRFSLGAVAVRYGPLGTHVTNAAIACVIDVACAALWAHRQGARLTVGRVIWTTALFLSILLGSTQGATLDTRFNLLPAAALIFHAQWLAPEALDLVAAAGTFAVLGEFIDSRLVVTVAPFVVVAAAITVSHLRRLAASGYAHAIAATAALVGGVAIFFFTPVYSVVIVGAFLVYGAVAATASLLRRSRIVAA